MAKDKKSKLTEQILNITGADRVKNFDQLIDRTEEYLTKLLKVCQEIPE